ncbi:MAG: AMP-binding protein [Chitinophagales bacterium]|nr:AMP-binding protein [Chitinophagales bacterium]
MFLLPFATVSHNVLLKNIKEKLQDDSLKDWERDVYTFAEAFLNQKNNSFSVFTSGSTGAPKLIKLTRTQLETSARATIRFFDLKEGDTALLALPANKIAGRMMIVRSILAKMNLYCVPLSSNPVNSITKEQFFDFTAFTPMQLAHALKDNATRSKTENFKTILLGGAEVQPELMKQILKLKNNIYQSYGMTETASHIALRKLNGSDRSQTYQTLEAITVSTDERNCLVIHAPYLSNNPIITNDLCKVYSPKEFEWIGRWDNIINSGGIKISPEIIEHKLAPLFEERFFVTGVPDELFGEKVVMALESKKVDPEKLKKIKLAACALLEKYEVPKQIILVSRFKETETGKILRKDSLNQAIQVINW